MAISVAALRPSLADQSDLVWFYIDAQRALGLKSNFESIRARLLAKLPRGGGWAEGAADREDAGIDAARRWRRIASIVFRLSLEDQATLRAYYADELTPPVLRALTPFGSQRAGVVLLTSAARRAVVRYELAARTAYTEDRLEREESSKHAAVPWCPGLGPLFDARPPPSPSQVLDALIGLAHASEAKDRIVREHARRHLVEVITEAESRIARASAAYREGESVHKRWSHAVRDRLRLVGGYEERMHRSALLVVP